MTIWFLMGYIGVIRTVVVNIIRDQQPMHNLVSLGQTHPNIAYLYAIIGNVALAVNQILFKYATKSLSSFQVMVFRSVLLLAFSHFVLKGVNQSPYITVGSTFRSVLVRICLAGTAATLMFYCVSFLPVSTITTVLNISPIFIFFIQAIAHKKPIEKVNFCLTLVSFAGIVLIVQPQFLFGDKEGAENGKGWYIGLMLIAALARAMNMHFIHHLAKKTHTFVNVHYSHLGFIAINAMLCNLSSARPPDGEEMNWTIVLLVLAIAVAAIFTQYFIFLANSIKQPSLVMPFGYAGVLVGLLADLFLFATQFTLLPIVGMVLTSAGLFSGFLFNTNILENKTTKKDGLPSN